MGSIKIPDGYCVKCNDGVLKPCIGKREKALCASLHYWPKHRRSEQGDIDDREYNKQAPIFLAQNSLCKMNFPGCTIRATQVHHMKGRGPYLLVQKWWLPCCTPCHDYEIRNSAEAVEKGVTILRTINI